MAYPEDDAKLKSWETALSAEIAKDPAPWNEYDIQIQTVCRVYDQHLTGVSGYVPLDWQLIKAVAWVESGAVNKAWKTAPMQIGVNGDPGLRELLSSPTGKLVVPPEYAKILTVSNVPVNPNLNFEAGVGYLLKITAMFGMQDDAQPAPLSSVPQPLAAIQPSGPSAPFLPEAQAQTRTVGGFSYGPALLLNGTDGLAPAARLPFAGSAAAFGAATAGSSASVAGPAFGGAVAPGGSARRPDGSASLATQAGAQAAAHARTHGSRHAPHKAPHPRAHKHLAIVGWRPRTLEYIAAHYNAGDGNYAGKLQFALDIMNGKVKPTAAPAAAPKTGKAAAKQTPMRLPQPGRR